MRRLLTIASLIVFLYLAGASHGALAAPVTPTPAPSSSFTASDAPTITVNPVQGPPISKQLGTRAQSSWPWYITRAAGFVAAAALVLLMLSGIGFITGTSFRFLEPLTAWATHKAIGIVFAVSATVHVVALLFDKFVPFTIAQALVPFLSHYREVTVAGFHLGSLYVALGIFGLYFVLAIILTSLFWIDKKPHIWKLFHFLAYLTMIFVFIHALYLGTDLTHGIFRVAWLVLGISVAIAIVYRLQRKVRAT